jgi:hypothetical protein
MAPGTLDSIRHRGIDQVGLGAQEIQQAQQPKPDSQVL